MSEWSVYILSSTVKNCTYVGYTRTLRVNKRLMKHNGLLVGGAKATTRNRPWQVVVSVDGLEKRPAMQLEWRMHRRYSGPHGLPGRLKQLALALRMEQWTSTAPKLCELVNLRVTWHAVEIPPPDCLLGWVNLNK